MSNRGRHKKAALTLTLYARVLASPAVSRRLGNESGAGEDSEGLLTVIHGGSIM